MVVYIVLSPIGLLAYEDEKLIEKKLFDKDIDFISNKIISIEEGKKVSELIEFSKKFKDPITKFPNKAYKYMRRDLREISLKSGFVESEKEFTEFMSSLGIAIVKKKIKSIEKRDKLIIHAINAMDDLDKILNIMSERLEEWYKLYYPEVKASDHEKLVRKILKYERREDFEDFSGTVGMDLKDDDISIIRNYARKISELYSLRKDIEKYINKVVPEEMPNTNALLGPTLTARLLSHAGSLEKLAKLSSSAIQLLGAEKALFRYLRSKGKKAKPPKYGILFTHPDINSAPPEIRGKIARLLSSKLSIAIRADFYTKEDISDRLLNDYKEKLKKIKEGLK